MTDIQHEIMIKSTPEKVFEAITTKKGLESWWTSDIHVSDDKKNYAFGFNNHSIVFNMKVEEAIPSEYVKWHCHSEFEEWEDTYLTFRISQKEHDITALKFKHSNWRSTHEMIARCNTDWGHLMYFLKDFAEGKNDCPFMS